MKVRYPGPAVTDPDAKKLTYHTAIGKLEGGKEYEFHPATIKPYVQSGLVEALEPLPVEVYDAEELAELEAKAKIDALNKADAARAAQKGAPVAQPPQGEAQDPKSASGPTLEKKAPRAPKGDA